MLYSNVTVIMVTFNRSNIIQESIDFVLRQNYAIANLVIVDNCSTDNTIELLELLHNDDNRIHIVRSNFNGGYASGLDIGINWAEENLQSDFYWLMDDDSHPALDALELLINNIKSSSYDMIGLTGFRQTWFSKKTLNPIQSIIPCDYILIDNALIKAEIIKTVGTPNPDFFMMCEDYEFCLRIRKFRYKIAVLQNDHVNRLHLGSGKFSSTTAWKGYYHARNHLLILKQYFSFKMLVNYIFIQSKYLIYSLIAKDRWLRLNFRLKGIYHGILSIKGKTLDPKSLNFATN
jgi:rhamnopyranosyl-N-acetylglucosaminyl-diphospho-decaprenol beta-1,3/1,4-galactofuranosyltransferase